MKRSHLNSVAYSTAALFLVSLFAFFLGKTLLATKASSHPQAPIHFASLPYYSVKGGAESTLTLNNAVPEPLTVSIVCYGLDGAALPLPAQDLRPFQNVSLRLSDLLAQTGEANGFREGSVELSFAHENGMALGPQLTVTNLAQNWSTDMEPLMGRQSKRLEGLWWSTGKQTDARLVLSNSLNEPLTVQMSIDYQGKRLPSSTLHLSSHQTMLLAIDEILRSLGIKAGGIGKGGISLSHDGPVGALNAHGFVINRKEKFSSTLHFVDPNSQHSTFLDGVGLPLGQSSDSSTSRSNFFTPRLLLRNITSEPQTANVSVQYTVSGEFKLKTLPPVNLGPYHIAAVDFSLLLNSLGTQPIDDAGIRVEASGAKGSIIGELSSTTDQGGSDVPLLSVRQNAARSGAHPFNFDENHLSILHLKNVGDKPTSAMVKILYEGGEYAPELIKMLPGQSVSFDLQAVRDGNVPDIHGHFFPGDVIAGQVTWLQHGDQPIIGRLVRSSLTDGVAATFSCGGPCSCPPVFDHAEFSPSSINGTSGDTIGSLTVNEYDKYEACPGLSGITEGPYAADADFMSDDSEIADVDNFGSQVNLNLAGGTLITATWETPTHNELNNECAEGGCETTCIPQSNPVSAHLTVAVKPKVEGISPEFGAIGTTVNVSISGRGFRSGSTVNVGGTGVSVSVSSVTNTTINGTFTMDIQSNVGGNHAITVTSNGKTSTQNVNFYVQIPTSLQLSIGNLRTHTGGSITDCAGNVRAQVAWGYSRLLTYTVMDQTGTRAITQTGMDATEDVRKVSSNPANAGGDVMITVAVGADGTFCDVQAFFTNASPPPQSGDFIKLKQTLSISVPGRTDVVRINCLNQQSNDVTITDTTSNPNATCQ